VSYVVEVDHCAARTLAVARGEARGSAIGPVLIGLLDAVYAFLRTSSVRQTGQNVAVYAIGSQRFEAGVEIDRPFDSQAPIYCSATPSGRLARTLHVGPYHELGRAHDAVQEFSRQYSHVLAGPLWEIYGDWHEDPNQLETEVFYLLS
jgi:effector-binding domain-containing protein